MDRRNFLRSTAFVASTAAWAGRETAAAGNPPKPLRVGLVGTGTQGQLLLRACMKIPGVRITAICDIWQAYNLRRAAWLLGRHRQEHRTYADYRELLAAERDLDAVILATPDRFHATQATACLEAGRHVYCESPMARTRDEAKGMVRAANATGKLLQIAHQRRSSPHYRFCQAHIINETKLLGKMTAANGQWNRPVRVARGYPRRAAVDQVTLNRYGFHSMREFRNWQWFLDFSAGPIADLGVHQVDVFNWYLGALPQSVRASGGTDYYDRKTHQAFDTVMAILEYPTPRGVVRAFYQTLSANSSHGCFETFMGGQGTLTMSEVAHRIGVYREPDAPEWDKWVRVGYLQAPGDKAKGSPGDDAVLEVEETAAPAEYKIAIKSKDPLHKLHLENFFNAVRGKEPLHCPAETAFAATAVVLDIAAAARSGKTVAAGADRYRATT